MKTKLNELLESNDEIYAFDVDGVLIPIEYGEYNHYMLNDKEWEEAIKSDDLYENQRESITIKDFISTKDINNIYVVSRVCNEYEAASKIKYLEKHFNIKKENMYFVKNDEDKLDALRTIKKLRNIEDERKIAMIDDTVSVLNNIMDNSNFATIHVSSFLK